MLNAQSNTSMPFLFLNTASEPLMG